MLNIGVLAAGSENYYLGSVARGAEDYYLGGEVPGRWIGRGADLLGLGGEVDGDDLVAVLGDRDPKTGTPLGCGTNRKVPGFDLTFSTPKSVSVLFGLGASDIALAVRDAHEEAVDAALGYVERHAVWSRRGRNGVDEVVGDGLVGAAFRHRTSRAGDPHLHTHVLVANTVRGPDGNWRTLDFRHVYAHAKTTGYLYEAHLRHLLTERLGLEWRPVRNGTAELAGIPDTVTRLFSTRRVEIEAALAARGETSARAAQVATLDTRRPKDREVDAIHVRHTWKHKTLQAGVDPAQFTDALTRAHPRPLTPTDHRRIEDHLAGPRGLTERASTFDRLDALRAWCDQLRARGNRGRDRGPGRHIPRPSPRRRADGREVHGSHHQSKWSGPVVRECRTAMVNSGTARPRSSHTHQCRGENRRRLRGRRSRRPRRVVQDSSHTLQRAGGGRRQPVSVRQRRRHRHGSRRDRQDVRRRCCT